MSSGQVVARIGLDPRQGVPQWRGWGLIGGIGIVLMSRVVGQRLAPTTLPDFAAFVPNSAIASTRPADIGISAAASLSSTHQRFTVVDDLSPALSP